MKKLFFYINLFIIYLLLIIPVKAQFDIKARTVILQDYLSGKILYEKSPDLMIFPASMTKIMTTIITFELLQKGDLSLDDKSFNFDCNLNLSSIAKLFFIICFFSFFRFL